MGCNQIPTHGAQVSTWRRVVDVGGADLFIGEGDFLSFGIPRQKNLGQGQGGDTANRHRRSALKESASLDTAMAIIVV
tara:strand:- start:252 stop:485 length:234 start_codon:yes stop_codon:yes gene_type:complete